MPERHASGTEIYDSAEADPPDSFFIAWIVASGLLGLATMQLFSALDVDLFGAALLAGWCCLGVAIGVWCRGGWALAVLAVYTTLLLLAGIPVATLAFGWGTDQEGFAVILAVILPGAPSVGWGFLARYFAWRRSSGPPDCGRSRH